MKEGLGKKVTLFIAPWLVPWLIRFLGFCIRVKVRDSEKLLEVLSDRPCLIAFWHNRGILMPYFYRQYFKSKIPGKVLISASRDGQLMADVVKKFDIGAVRGSSSKHAVRAMKEIVRELQVTKMHLAMAPDGPRGPIYKVQPGIVYLAANSGLPIIPVTYHFAWKWQMNSWDRLPIPLPFSRCELVIGELLYVGMGDDLAIAAEKLARRLGC
jgi:lysophospholipid acyltransferase (LPLAT)-like uncharacterized protein